MSRGALLLQRADANHELDYVPFASGVVRRGPRAPGVAKPKSAKRAAMEPPASPAPDARPRDAGIDDIDALAALWHEGWHDAHAAIIPVELARVRTLENFRERLQAALAETRVVGPRGAPSGFTILHRDELYQFYVARTARGTGVARALMADAEDRLARSGVATAWLACAIGNERAARFYEKQGWRRAGVATYPAETPSGVFMLDVWRYEKTIDSDGRSAR